MTQRFTPRYYEIELALRARISELSTGDALPSDTVLSRHFGVSRMTVRQAFHALVNEGLVERRPGIGTFVADKSPHRQATVLVGFSEEMRRQGRVPTSEVISTEVRPAAADEAHELGVAAETNVVAIRRLRCADGVPIAIEQATLRIGCEPVLGHDLVAGSMHAALRDEGIVLASGRATIRSDRASRDEARLLDVRTGEPLLVERRLIFDTDGVPTELTESRYATGRYELDVEFVVDMGAVRSVPPA